MKIKNRNDELECAVSGKKGEKMNISAIDKIYNYLSGEKDYADLPETEEARRKLKAYLVGHILSPDDEEAHEQWMGLEKEISDFGIESERQGFIYGFRYASELFVRNGNPCSSRRLDEHIRDEYSTLAADGAERIDGFADVLKEHVPEEKYGDVMDSLCVCLERTKYAVFEQGFLRGIAAEKGGNI